MIATIKRLLARLFWRHSWVESCDMRTCVVCGKREIYDMDPWGDSWIPIRRGDPDAHRGTK